MICVVMSWPVQSCRVSLMGSFDSTSACAAPAAPRPTASADRSSSRLLRPQRLDQPLQRRPGTVQPYLHRALGDADRRGRLAGAPAFEVPQQQCRAIGIGQPVDPGPPDFGGAAAQQYAFGVADRNPDQTPPPPAPGA